MLQFLEQTLTMLLELENTIIAGYNYNSNGCNNKCVGNIIPSTSIVKFEHNTILARWYDIDAKWCTTSGPLASGEHYLFY